ncbi:MAG TPA: hypothetical protein VLB84_19765 [Bacteroidia bacterium]|nr:hypothetical protein [Bacteroidia bacterium]
MPTVTIEVANIRINIISDISGLINRFKEMYYHFVIADPSNAHVTLEIKSMNMEQFIHHESLPFDHSRDFIKTNYIYSAAYNPVEKKAVLLTNLKNLYPFSEDYLLNLFTYVCLEHNKLLFHSSVLYDDNNNAYIFYGPSGIGKSTFARNSSGYEVLSDDLVIIETQTEHLFKLYKTPFERNKKQHIPLTDFNVKGFFRLNHAPTLKIKKLNASEKIAMILGNIWNLDFSEATQQRYIDLISTNFKTVPGYHLLLANSTNLSEFISLLS